VPCIHADPMFPDCPPGETVTVSGYLRFYEGTDVRSVMQNQAEQVKALPGPSGAHGDLAKTPVACYHHSYHQRRD
jgi:hypothetical protein